ncbi:MAG TPA: chemotaxis protein CheZ [Stenotrophomonas sp.]|nr:chemotaxis protein CheZ [Stenotrophomonas sp.]
MSDDVDLEALFDEISAQALPTSVASAAPAAAASNAQPAVAEDQSDKPMYERLGGIVRLLHDSMRELGYDRSLTDVAAQIGDAQGRLEHVATLTEQAANKVLNALDSGMPAQDRLQEHAKNINERWARLYAGQMSIDEFKQLAGDSQKFSTAVLESTEAEKARMLEIMMAQDFQDLTGQVIKRVTQLAHDLESQLVQLLVDYSPGDAKKEDTGLLNGPQIDPAGKDVIANQGQVDDLLESLGF